MALLHTFCISAMAVVLAWNNDISTDSPINIVAVGGTLMVYCGVIFLPLICLASYHCQIAANGETTKEEIKKIHAAGENPEDRGCLSNWHRICCRPVPESNLKHLRDLIDRTGANGAEDDVELNVLAGSTEEQALVQPPKQVRAATNRRDGYAVIALTDEEEKELCSQAEDCLLYTSDAADEEDSVDLGGRRIIKKKKTRKTELCVTLDQIEQVTIKGNVKKRKR
eukprot:TRINITY_DN13574_c0_g1_i1.p1 TRINITY_DN13574_c0_g1~~TRINITY_DN13574_c0_g1_i1.p1  ORF type:complete len:225 (-),score=60.17 TRINITY_DN13574_c0_g1_i1:38-712(-)